MKSAQGLRENVLTFNK